jgi:8-oxo-dGTP pyrophosphatase MutT (NUDIX family)
VVTGDKTVAFHRRINEVLLQQFPDARSLVLPGGHNSPMVAVNRFLEELASFHAKAQ